MNTKRTNPFTKLFAGLERDEEYLAVDFAESFDREIRRAMAAQGVSRKELAERMNVSPARVTKLLSGEKNLTVRSMVKVALALDLKVSPKVGKIGATESVRSEVTRPRGRRVKDLNPMSSRFPRSRGDRSRMAADATGGNRMLNTRVA